MCGRVAGGQRDWAVRQGFIEGGGRSRTVLHQPNKELRLYIHNNNNEFFAILLLFLFHTSTISSSKYLYLQRVQERLEKGYGLDLVPFSLSN